VYAIDLRKPCSRTPCLGAYRGQPAWSWRPCRPRWCLADGDATQHVADANKEAAQQSPSEGSPQGAGQTV